MKLVKITRWILVLAALVAATLAVTGCESCRGEPEIREREPLSLLPADSIIVASAEVPPVIRSEAYKRVKRNTNPVEYYLGECSYDPLPHIDKIWMSGGADVLEGKGVMVVIGPVNRDKVLQCYRDDTRRRGLSVEEEEVEGFTVYSAGPGRLHLAWIDAETAVVGSREPTLKVLALERGKGESVRSNPKLFKLWERMAKGQDVAVAVLPTEDQLERLGKILPKAYKSVARSQQAALSLRLSKGMDLKVMVRVDNGEDGEALSKRLTRDIERWSVHEYAEIAGVDQHLKAIRIERAGPEITGTAHWSEKQVRSLAGLAVDSIDEVMRSSDPEKALRERFTGGGDAGAADAAAAEAGAAETDGGPTADAANSSNDASAPATGD